MQRYADSPGLSHDFLAVRVLEIAQMILALGWEATLGLGPHIRCSLYEEELVREGLLWALTRHEEMRQSRQRKGR